MLIKKYSSQIKPGDILVVEGYKSPNKHYIVLSIKNEFDIAIKIKLLGEDLKTCVWYNGLESEVNVLC